MCLAVVAVVGARRRAATAAGATPRTVSMTLAGIAPEGRGQVRRRASPIRIRPSPAGTAFKLVGSVRARPDAARLAACGSSSSVVSTSSYTQVWTGMVGRRQGRDVFRVPYTPQAPAACYIAVADYGKHPNVSSPQGPPSRHAENGPTRRPGT